MEFLLRPHGGVWDLRGEREEEQYFGGGIFLPDFVEDGRVGGSWARYPGVLAGLGGLPPSPPRLGFQVAHRGCDVGALQETCLDSVDGVAVWGASSLHQERRASGLPPRPARSGKEGGPREGEAPAGFLSLRVRTDASS